MQVSHATARRELGWVLAYPAAEGLRDLAARSGPASEPSLLLMR
jgi:hypothetical protein